MKQFRSEIGDAAKGQIFSFAEGVGNANGTVIRQADDVAGVSFGGLYAVACHECHGICHLHAASQTHVMQAHALAIATRTNPQEGNAVSMARVHVRLNLEDEARETSLGGGHGAACGFSARWGWRVLD